MPLSRRTGLKPGKGLSPGKPLQRKTPLASGDQLKSQPIPRKTAMPRATPPVDRARTPAPPRAQRPRTPARRTGATPEVRQLVHARDGGLCVRCGAPASDLDHRRGRGMGGTKGEDSARINGPAWLLTLCGSGNTSGCHGRKEANRHDAEREGYRIPRNAQGVDAERVPVLTRAGWVLFDNAGGWRRAPEPVDGDARNAS